jgi:integrase
VAIFTGLRRREVVFLQRSDIDLLNAVISVRSKPHLGFRPKSGKERSIPIDPVLRPLLVKHLAERVGPGPEAWVFPQTAGARRSERTRWFALSTQAAATRAGISRKLTFHDLRRTYGAMLIEAGVDIYTVSRLLGHADVRITQEVYAPLCGRFMAEQAAKLGRHIGRALVRELPPLPSLRRTPLGVDQ